MENLEQYLAKIKTNNEIKKQSNELKPLLLKINNPEKGYLELNKDGLKTVFKAFYEDKYKRKYILESEDFLNLLIDYFFKDEEFYNSELLIKKFNKIPSLDKGLLIIGDVGVGKSSTLDILQTIFEKECRFDSSYRFRKISVQNLVLQYEKKENYISNDDFFNKYKTGFLCIDDVKSERKASSFGKINLIQEILYLRYEKKARTILTCNFKEGCQNDLNEALNEFGELYGSRIYDRIFELFNIIHVSKKSSR